VFVVGRHFISSKTTALDNLDSRPTKIHDSIQQSKFNRQSKSSTTKKLSHKRSSSVYGCGLAASGALAEPEFINPRYFPFQLKQVNKPCRISHFNRSNIAYVAAGFGFSLFASKKSVIGAGLNTCGQLGFHASKSNATKSMQWLVYPKQLCLPDLDAPIIGIACGRTHSLIGTRTSVYAIGNNSLGQCGRTIIENEDYANCDIVHRVALPTDSDVVQVVAGFDTSFVLLADGRIYTFGLGADGARGNGSYTTDGQPQLVVGDVQNEPIVKLACSADTVLAVSANGQLFGWGQSEYGQFAMITDEPQVPIARHLPFAIGHVIDAAASGTACLVLNSSGDVYVWGYGILGQGPETTILDRPGLLPSTLFNATQRRKVKSVHAGPTHMAAINADGELYVWGSGRYGILGLGHDNDQFFPLKVYIATDVNTVTLGADHTLLLSR
jgi:alpha-tubulin suppressor-like RCC1 family protein